MKACVESNTLKNFLDAVCAVTDEARIQPHEGGWRVLGVDNAHVLMVQADLDESEFSAHTPAEDGIVVDVEEFSDVVGLATGNERVEMHAGDGKLTVMFGNITRRLGLISNRNANTPKIPELSHDATVTAPMKHVKRALRATDSISDATTLKATPQGTVAKAKGNTDDVTYKLDAREMPNHEADTTVEASYSNGYLFNVTKACPAPRIELAWASDHPLELSWEANGVSAMYLLAPRIENQ